MSLIPVLRKQRQENLSLRPAWSTKQVPELPELHKDPVWKNKLIATTIIIVNMISNKKQQLTSQMHTLNTVPRISCTSSESSSTKTFPPKQLTVVEHLLCADELRRLHLDFSSLRPPPRSGYGQNLTSFYR